MKFLLEAIQPVSLSEQVVERVRDAIIEGRLKPNDHITEASLTAQLGVSRTPVREALILLEHEGLVVSIPNKGFFVRAFTRRDVQEIFSMRTHLEILAAELTFKRLAAEDYTHLTQLIEKQKTHLENGDFENARHIDMEFHRYLVCLSKHSLLIRYWSEIVAQIAALLYIRAEAFPNYHEDLAIRDHHAILDAYQRNDLDSVKAMIEKINIRVSKECQAALEKISAEET